MNGIAVALVCLVSFVVVLFIGVHLYAYGCILLDSIRLKQMLRANNRVLSLGEAKERLKKKQGMIIVDAPTLGWNVSRVWWSPTTDFVARPDSWSNDTLCPAEDLINHQRFIEPSSGVALLVDGFVFTQRVKRFLNTQFGSEACSFVFTGGVLAQRGINEKQAKA